MLKNKTSKITLLLENTVLLTFFQTVVVDFKHVYIKLFIVICKSVTESGYAFIFGEVSQVKFLFYFYGDVNRDTIFIHFLPSIFSND